MRKCLVFGYGQMGQCITYAMEQLGWEVHTVDMRSTDRTNHHIFDFEIRNTPAIYRKELNAITDKVEPHIIISSLPYFLNTDLATHCIVKGIAYCDLGGDITASAQIKKLAEKATAPVMTDLGLAPGWINIIAAHGVSLVQDADSVEMAVGGILAKPIYSNPLNYKLTWSIDGLLNEYKKDCVVLENGEIVKVKALDGYKEGDSYVIQGEEYFLEAFYTSGGSAHSVEDLQKAGIKNCHYRTLRWPGHNRLVKWLVAAEISNVDFTKLVQVGVPPDLPDMVIMSCLVRGHTDTYYNKKIRVGATTKFTAMQRATSYPLAAIANWLGTSPTALDGKYFYTYHDVCYVNFQKSLEKLFSLDKTEPMA